MSTKVIFPEYAILLCLVGKDAQGNVKASLIVRENGMSERSSLDEKEFSPDYYFHVEYAYPIARAERASMDYLVSNAGNFENVETLPEDYDSKYADSFMFFGFDENADEFMTSHSQETSLFLQVCARHNLTIESSDTYDFKRMERNATPEST